MGYLLTFLAGMGFAALLDLMYAAILRYRIRRTVSLDIETGVSEVFAVDPTSTQVGKKQMAALRKRMGI